MTLRFTRNDWRHYIWRVVSHPAFEAIAVVAVVVIATWVVVDTTSLHRASGLPLLYGHK